MRSGQPPVTLYSGLHGFTETAEKPIGGLHSLTISNDGRKAYFALLPGGFAVVDVSDFATGKPAPQPRPITINEARPTWPGPGAHSAVKLWGRDWAWVSDEVYGTPPGATTGARGAGRGWSTSPTRGRRRSRASTGEPENDPATCADWNPPQTSYSAHNPTLTPHIAFSTWHSGGLQAVSVDKPQPSRPSWPSSCPSRSTRCCSRIRGSRPTPTRAGTRRS